jgi:hydroxymethylbilane synthase
VKQTLRLGTRASPLALAQAEQVRAALLATHAELEIEIIAQIASGDRILDRALAEVGGKALWTKELDAMLLNGETDFSVHSMKDVETQRPAALEIVAMLERADVRDRLIGAASFDDLAKGAKVGTSAPRRRAQLLRLRPDLEIVLIRGNVQTRLAKIERGEAAATLLASAGLDRLGLDVGSPISLGDLLPAPSQGAIGIECRSGDEEIGCLIKSIDHLPTHQCIAAERAFLAGLSGDCRSPVAAYAVFDGPMITLRAEIYSADGTQIERGEGSFAPGDYAGPEALGTVMLTRAHRDIQKVFGPPVSG